MDENLSSYKNNYITTLRDDIVSIISEKLTPAAEKYGYSDSPLEENVKWKPKVLLLGNYSSGKSTLVNDFLGGNIQRTGQAPTDDTFTVIAYKEAEDQSDEIRVIEEREGRSVLNDPEYPFVGLKKHGDRFLAHFRLKFVNSPFLKQLVIIDTPGMLDSVTETDRGYNYQDVIGELAQNSDLVLLLFDPHKTATGNEAHTSIRETLPKKCFEDRILFVLNRVDECTSLEDFLQVYGTLCWNLSQMTGRKDIPQIYFTYSPHVANHDANSADSEKFFIQKIENQRELLKAAVLKAPHYQLDHLADFLDTHCERLHHLLEVFIQYKKKMNGNRNRFIFFMTAFSILLGLAAGGAGFMNGLGDLVFTLTISAGVAVGTIFIGMLIVFPYFRNRFHEELLGNLDTLTKKKHQNRIDSWNAVKQSVVEYLTESRQNLSLRKLRKEFSMLQEVMEIEMPEVREGLQQLNRIE
ncbi:MAG: dynamin family protein [Deltaproteobacteria bacterium]|nr:dynamin family protein [Deltaproteobacteria bacterium]